MARVWLVALLFAVLVPPVQAQDTLDLEQRAWLEAHGPIRYGYEPHYAPFEFADRQGAPAGINLDLLDAMARNLGFKVEKVQYPNFTALQQALQRGDVDVLGSINRTAERDAFMDFSAPYVRLSSVFYVTDRHADVHTVQDLQGLRVAVVDGYVSATWLSENHPDLDLHAYDDLAMALEALVTGDVDVLFEESATVGFMVRQNAFTNVRVLDAGTFLVSDQHWVVKEGEPALASILDAGMASIPPGDQTKIFEYWTGYDLGVSRPGNEGFTEAARNLIIGVTVVLVVAIIWSIVLRAQVKSRTAELREELALREAAEAEVRELNEDLETRVARRTEQLERSNRDLEEFAHAVSHDLQQPLDAIAYHVTALKQMPLAPAAAHTVDVIGAKAVALRDMVLTALDFARATADAPKHETELKAVLHAATSDLEALIRSTGTRVEVSDLPRVHGNPLQLKRVFENLIINGIKYGRPDVAPRIRVVTRSDEDHWIVDVHDNGRGFTGEISDLTGLFIRRHEDVPGHGVGLATCARILSRHEGRLDARTVPGQGSIFSIWLPKLASGGRDEPGPGP